MPRNQRRNQVYGIGDDLLNMPPLPIISTRAPQARDRAEIGTLWVDQPNDDVYILTSVVANVPTWINTGGGTGTFNALTVTTTATIGTTLLVGGAVTLSALGLGVVQSSATGVLSSSDGIDGQVLIASTGAAAPAWATLTAGPGIIIANAAGGITIEATGAIASSFATDVGGPVVPLAGETDFLGGTNVTSDGSVANTVTFNLDDSVTLAGSLTAGVDLTMTAGDCTITGTTDAVRTIYLHANGGVNESIDLRSNQGTALDSISLLSDDGGIAISAGVANASAIRLLTGNAAGGLDFDAGSGGVTIDSIGGAISLDSVTASNFTVTGAADLTLSSTLGAVVIDSGEAANDAIDLFASNAAGGITAIAGTGGITMGANNGTIQITSGTSPINIGTDATVHTATFGGLTGAAATVVQSGTGNTSITSTGTIDLDATGNVSMNSTAGTLNIGDDANAFAVNIATGAAARIVTIGNVSGASQVVLNSGTAGVAINTTGAGDFVVTSADTVLIDSAGVLELNSSAGVISIGNDAVAQNINIGTGAAARVISVGNTTAATTVTVDAGTGGILLTSTGTGDIVLDSDDTVLIDSDGVLELNSSAGIISIGNDDIDQAINVGTTGERPITVGNVVGATGISLDAGTSGIDINATGGLVSMTPATATVAGAALTIDANVGVATFTGQTTASAAIITLTITNAICTVGSAILCSASNLGANDARMTVVRVTPGAGSFVVILENQGPAALNGDIIFTFWIVAA